ncbi:HIT family protein [Frigoriflavimonas asaccharolytica]|uniref:Histidine triad (HIT) family protein n=1 Tax=Frigoriflavimonas asaccharolytica TaxID=2735899 RepID=A0A8J8G766_9FLAO|nr:HIT family protein [Frigoriflavimonas asaccharolytica]NRS92529.1 histidine triad (HIT) family protein [Frigoriflavimonas asaccharolytica]
MSSIFTKIINNEIPAYKIAEDENFLAFLDVSPIAEGHTLVIPKKEIDLIFDLETEDFKNLWSFAQMVAKKIQKAIPCKRVGVAVIGLEVPHAHIHLVPMHNIGDLDFGKERLQLSKEEYKKIQETISNAL